MKLYGAIDLHSTNNVMVVINEHDQVVYQKRLPNDLSLIAQQLSSYRRSLEGIVVESTYNWYWLVDGLMEKGYRLHLANTAAIQQYNGLKYTDDHSDARWLAHLLRLGISAVSLAAGQIMGGLEDLVVAGGTDMLSVQAGIIQREAAAGITLSLDVGNARLQASHPQSHQGVCGDAIASIEGIDREALDRIGLESQRRAAVAIAEGRFDKSVIPVRDEEGNVVLDREEFPRPETTMEGLAQLKPAFAGEIGRASCRERV